MRTFHCGGQPAAIFGFENLPTGSGKERFESCGANPGNDPVQTLPVEVDDPDHVAQSANCFFGHRFPDIAFVELGIADQRDKTPRCNVAEVQLAVLAGEGGIHRSDRAKSDRTGGKVNWVGILGPAGIGLQPFEFTEGCQVGTIQIAEQVLSRMKHRRSMRFDGNAVPASQKVKVQGRDDR